MNSSFSYRDNLVTLHQMKKEQNENLKAFNECSEEVEPSKIQKPQEGKDELQSEDTDKGLNTETENGDKTNDKQKQGTSNENENENDCKSPCGNNNGMKNSTEDSELKTKSEQSNGIVNLNSDVNNKEELNECCQRKRKRCEIEWTSYNQKFQESGLTCIGILPGLEGNIESSDDSDQSSSGSEINESGKYDFLGRRIVYGTKCSTESG